MKKTQSIMGMTVSVEIVDLWATEKDIEKVFAYFKSIDERFSTYKKTSEITAINDGTLKMKDYSPEMKLVLELSEKTKQETTGYFDIIHNGKLDPSGLVKGWAIYNAAEILKKSGFKNFYVDAGGDIQTFGKNSKGKKWTIGIRNPFNKSVIVKIVEVSGEGVATSGTYERREHIYNPLTKKSVNEIASLTVVGPNIYEADRFATAAFAMGKQGIDFIERKKGLEGYMIGKNKVATFTTGFEKYVQEEQ